EGKRTAEYWTIQHSRFPATKSSNVGPNGFHFPPSGRRIRAGRRPGGPTNQRVEIPSEQNRHVPRNLSSTAKQNDKIPQGNIYRGVGGSFSNSTLNEVFPP